MAPWPQYLRTWLEVPDGAWPPHSDHLMGRYVRLQQLMFLQQVVHRSQVFAVILRCQKGLHLVVKQKGGKVTAWCTVCTTHSGRSGKPRMPLFGQVFGQLQPCQSEAMLLQ